MRLFNKKFFFFLLTFLLFSPFLPYPRGGQIINWACAIEVSLPGLPANPTLEQYLSYLFNGLLQTAWLLVVLTVIVAGIYYMISLGRSKETSEAKEWLKAGLTGLLLLASSYIILYTINTSLVSLGTGEVVPIIMPQINLTAQTGSTVPSINYNEIPAGTLIENVLARPIDCFDFDNRGEPIDASTATTDIIEPSLRNHDRVDCILKLAKAISIKSKIAGELSEEISKLMDTCRCDGKCDTVGKCDPAGDGSCPGISCSDEVRKNGCIAKKSTGGSSSNNNASCCEPDVKQKIDHGDITLPSDSCASTETSINNFNNRLYPKTYVLGDIIPAAGSPAPKTSAVLALGTPPKITLSISPGSSSLAPGERQDYTITGTDETGKTVPVSAYLSADDGAGCSNSSCTPTAEGDYTITAILTSDTSVSAEAQLSVKKLGGDIYGPNPAIADSSNPTYYFAQGTGGSGDYTYSWSSADGSLSGSGDQVSLQFDSTGKKTINVTVTDSQGQSSPPVTLTIMVYSFMNASCSVSKSPVDADEEVTLTAVATGGKQPYSYEWTLPDGAADCKEGNTKSKTCVTSFKENGIKKIKVKIEYEGQWYPNFAACTVNVGNVAENPNAIKYKGLDEFTSNYKGNDSAIPKDIETKDKDGVTVIDKKKWDSLMLIDKIKYLKEKIKQISLEKDLDQLKKAKQMMSSQACYFIKSYVDFIKLVQTTPANKYIIKAVNQFTDPITGEKTQRSKYCAGYEYQNTNFFYTCQSRCPLIAKENVSCLAKCACPANDPNCAQAEACIKICLNNSPCKSGTNTGNNTAGTNGTTPANGTDNTNPAIDTNAPGCAQTCPDNKTTYNTCQGQSYFNTCCSQPGADPSLCQPVCGDGVCDTGEPATCVEDCPASDCVGDGCPGTGGTGGNGTFQGCMESLRQTCLDNCSQQYPCPDESADLKNCQDVCNNNSKDLLQNMGSCVFNSAGLASCAKKYKDANAFENFYACANSELECMYASDQNAGGWDCLDPKYIKPGQSFSSYYLYNNPDKQIGKECHSTGTSTGGIASLGIEQYPGYQACPVCSSCPKCPLLAGTPTSGVNNATNGTNASPGPNLSESLLTATGQCGGYLYNDDPLTFYCRQDYWNQESEKTTAPLGSQMVCPSQKDIPIGQTIDSTVAWAQKIIDAINEFVTKTNNLVNHMGSISAAAGKNDYCQCNSPCGKNAWGVDEKACNGDCVPLEIFNPPTEDDPYGSWDCSCMLQPCQGGSCQRMINLLRGKTWDQSCPQGIAFCGMDCYYDSSGSDCSSNNCGQDIGIKQAYDKLAGIISDSRTENSQSENLKRLSYSRKTMDDCSAASAVYGQQKILTCQRARDQILSPETTNYFSTVVNGEIQDYYCYGSWLGQVLGSQETLSDNWFCCETRQ